MWIVPQQLIASSGFLATEGTISELSELSHACAASLLVRSKRMRTQTWSKRLKAGGWSRFLCGRIVKPSHAKSFEDWWISSLQAIRVRDSVQPESKKVRKTLASYGLGYCGQLQLFNLAGFSSRTSRTTSTSDSEQSLAIWNRSVIEQRGEYSQRLRLALHTPESGSLSWPTPNTMPEAPNSGVNLGGGRIANRNKTQSLGKAAQENWKTPHGFCGQEADGSYGGGEFAKQVKQVEAKQWPTPAAAQSVQGQNEPDGKRAQTLVGAARGQDWATPQAHDAQGGKTPDQIEAMRKRTGAGVKNLNEQVANWPTPRASESENRQLNPSPSQLNGSHGLNLAMLVNHSTDGQPAQESNNSTGNRPGQLNPDWVEALMGIPIGWTDCVCAETELSRLPQPELGLFSANGSQEEANK